MSAPKVTIEADEPVKQSRLAKQIGVGAAAILLGVGGQPGFTEFYEGMVLRGYIDPVGVLTKCAGDTYDVELGKRYTMEECKESLQKQLVNHAAPVMKCAPYLAKNPFFVAMAVDHNYHFGTFCGKTVEKTFKSGNYAEACKRFNTNADGSPAWVFASRLVNGPGGTKVKEYYQLGGLVKRAAARREICNMGITWQRQQEAMGNM